MMNTVGNNIKILMKNDISSESILDNPFLIVMNEGENTFVTAWTEINYSNFSLQFSDELQAKLDILLNFNLSSANINDFVPLLQINQPYLRQIFDLFAQEQSQIPCENRIHYFSRKLNVGNRNRGTYSFAIENKIQYVFGLCNFRSRHTL